MKLDYTPTISVIIPTYNRANTIVRCIESVLAQSYSVNEIIIVDDYSSDSTIKQLCKFKDEITILKTYKQIGAQAVRNMGIKAAKSDWIAFLDSDDEWLPNKIEKQVEELEKLNFESYTVVHCDCYVFRSEKNEKYVWNLPVITGRNVYTKLLQHPAPMFQGMLTSQKALEKINYLDDRVPSFQEWDTSIRLAKYCRFIHIQEPLFIYNQHNGETISSNSTNYFIGYQYIVNKHKQEIIKYCGEKTFHRHLFTNAKFAMNSGNFKNGKKVLQDIKLFSIYIMVLRICAILHIKPKYFISFRSFVKGLA